MQFFLIKKRNKKWEGVEKEREMLRKVVAVVRWFNQTPCRPKRGRFFTSLQLLSPVSLFESLPFQIILPF
jgi:hypothetical protein